jgi:hypothetical protein
MQTTKIEIITSGRQGGTGFAGYSPVFSVVGTGTFEVLRVVDWVGGQGPKPAINQYVSKTGLTTNLSQAINLKGSDDTSKSVILSSNQEASNNAFYVADPVTARQLTFPAFTDSRGFMFRVYAAINDKVSFVLPAGYTVFVVSSRSIGSTFEEVTFSSAGTPSVYTLKKGLFEIRLVTDGSRKEVYIF